MRCLTTCILPGFIAGALSVLTFHQGMWALLHVLEVPGLTMPPPYPVDAIPPLHVPRLISLCFWGGLWGVLLNAIWPARRAPMWVAGLCLGVAAVLTGYFIVAPLKGLPIAGGWHLNNWARSLLINGTWGLGVGLLLTAYAIAKARADDAANR